MQLKMKRVPVLSAFAAAAVLAGCATTKPSGPPGKHLIYRDSSGVATRQFDYPDLAFCQRVEAMAGRGAYCQAEPATGLTAKATLRYNPPGLLVEGHYQDMNRCRTDTAALPGGVQLINACAPK
jgi:hypothetical protein